MPEIGFHFKMCKKLHKKLKQRALKEDKSIKTFITELIEKALN